MMSVLGETPDHNLVLPVYSSLLGACAEMHDVNYANKCLDLMDCGLLGKNEITNMELLKVYMFDFLFMLGGKCYLANIYT